MAVYAKGRNGAKHFQFSDLDDDGDKGSYIDDDSFEEPLLSRKVLTMSPSRWRGNHLQQWVRSSQSDAE